MGQPRAVSAAASIGVVITPIAPFVGHPPHDVIEVAHGPKVGD
jgi:hypothetical protein